MIVDTFKWINDIPGLGYFIGFFAGFFVQRFTLTADKKRDLHQKKHDNCVQLEKIHSERYAAYVAALSAYSENQDSAGFTEFVKISSAGDQYFSHLALFCEAALDGHLTTTSKESLVALARRCVDDILPLHFSTLDDLAKKRGFVWKGKLRRADFQAIYAVVERFAHLDLEKSAA